MAGARPDSTVTAGCDYRGGFSIVTNADGGVGLLRKVLFTGAHSERHTKQNLEVKTDTNYSKK